MEHPFTKIIDLLFSARQKGIEVILNDERLQLKTSENVEIDEQLLNDIRSNKQSIIEYLSGNGWKAVSVNGHHKKITVADKTGLQHIPASFSQERLWFIDHLSGSVEYHSPTVIRLTGRLNKAALSAALQTIIQRHEVLRTVFYEKDGHVYQLVKEGSSWEMSFEDVTAYQDNPEGLKGHIEQLVKAPFNLAADFPIRSTLITLTEEEHILVVTLHHIASDAWSTGIMVNEFAEGYNARVEGREPNLPALPLQYADFALWQRAYLKGEVLDKKIAYWQNKLQGHQHLQLPISYSRQTNQPVQGASVNFSVDKNTTARLRELAQKEGASLYMALLAAFKVLLSRYSGQQDITVGTSIASRQQKELEGLIGFFVNTLALRDEVAPDVTFNQLLQQVKETTLGAYEHQDIPFEKVVEVAVKERDPERNPLFQVMLVLANTPEAGRLRLGDVELARESFAANISKFELTFFISETLNGLAGHIDYRTDLFATDAMNRMAAHFVQLLASITTSPFQKVSLLPIMPAGEERQLLQDFNNSEVAYPADTSVVDLFEQQAANNPGETAVVFDGKSLTYQQLNELANQVAHCLISKGVVPGALVPLYIQRSAEMMVGMLGIMKAGAAYVPIDVDFPADRISYMLADTGATVVVSTSFTHRKTNVTNDIAFLEIDIVSNQPKDNITVKPDPHHLAYVIYTSGSTGQPKGVMVEHRHLLDYYYGLDKNIQISRCRSFALTSTIATDLGNTVIYGALLSGGALHLFSKESVSNAAYLHRYFTNENIDCLKIVPSHWQALRSGDELLLPQKLIVFGGEALPAEVVEEIRQSGAACHIVNHYGPTETTIGKLLYPVNTDAVYGQTVPIGRPFSNTKVYVLTGEMQLCPPGIQGQLYIAGHGVARGYLNNEALTRQKFVPNPFSPADGRYNILYATGDLVKWLPDGNIEFRGRVDDQVKIRGYRVEPGEIENVLRQCESVSGAAVLARPDKQGNTRLVAYLVPTTPFNKEAITACLKEKLPEYMVPSVLIPLENLPLTANGKIDRKALPNPDAAPTSEDAYTAPRTEAEQQMAALWADVLELDEVSIHSDFFELGGHSLLAVRLISAIRKAFNVEMPIGDIFDYPTVAALSGRLPAQQEATLLPAIVAVQPRPEHIPLSFSQERLWFIDKLDGSLQYHVPAVIRLTGKINKPALETALQNVVNRHEVLRTVILEEAGRPYQVIHEQNTWQLTVVDGPAYVSNPEGLQHYIHQLTVTPFDLSKDDMIRGHLIALGEEEHILVVTLHHIASDGWSRSVLIKEVVEGYSAFEENRPVHLPALPVQYADFAIWQRNYMQGELLEKKLQYWKEKLQGLSPLQLPVDYSRPKVQTTKGALTNFLIDELLSQQLQEVSRQQGVTLFMTLLAAFKILLHRYSGQHDICVGTPIAGRQQQELEGLIGFFVNTLALRTNINPQLSFTEVLRQVKETTIAAYEHQEVPFEKVVDAVVKERDMSRSPLFQVLFVLQNTPDVAQLRLGDLQLSAGGLAYESVKFEIVLSVTETAKGLVGSFGYLTDLYSSTTINRMISQFKQLLHSIAGAPQQKIALLPMLSPSEAEQLLTRSNNINTAYPTDTTIVALFEEQVIKTPEHIALVYEGRKLTYRQLNERANQLAHHLQSKGVQPQALVPVVIERSLDMIISVLAILKVGAAYVPVDPEYPEERIRFMLEDTASTLLITSQQGRLKLTALQTIEIIDINEADTIINDQLKTNLSVTIAPHYLIYIIYTSGSTGTPKGVMITHRNIVRLFKTDAPVYDFNDQDVWALFHSLSFDFSVWEIFGALLFGGKLVVLPKEVTQDVSLFSDLIVSQKVTVLNQTPSAFYVLQNHLVDAAIEMPVRYVIFGGEALNPARLQPWKQQYPSCRLINMYGITEITVHATYHEIEEQDIKNSNSIIGKPIPTLSCYIVDQEKNIVPTGIPGEIYIGGAGVAKGYLNRKALTAERFISNPFDKNGTSGLYKTGDLGRWLENGDIEYLGRIDEQVKIRGYRIELGEIETVLQQSNLIRQAVVVAKEDGAGTKRLVCYYVAANEPVDTATISAYLQNKLPDYMVPALYVQVQHIPLTANGKTDKKALPDIAMNELPSNAYVAPRNEVEEKFAEVWQQVLGISRIGIEDNFFELGGDSILTIQVVSRIRRLKYELQPKDLFVHQTIKGLASLVANHSGISIAGEQGALQGACGLLPIQQWYLQRNVEDVSYFNQSVLFGIDKIVTEAILKEAVNELIVYHDVLRFRYRKRQDEWYQEYQLPDAVLTAGIFITEDFTAFSKEEFSKQVQHCSEKYQQSLDIEKGELIKVVLIQSPGKKMANRLLIIIHHLAVDGVSWRILLEHLEVLISELIKGNKTGLGSKGSSYRQWFDALKQFGKSEPLLAQTTYWNNITTNSYPLPVDYAFENEIRQADTLAYRAVLNAVETQKLLQQVPRAYQTEINDLLLCALSQTICSWTGKDKAIIGLEGHGREDIADHIDISHTTGWFTSLFPVLLHGDVSKGEAFLINEVKQHLHHVPDKGLGYGVLKYINREISLQEKDCWEIVFNYLGQVDNVVNKSSFFTSVAESAGASISDQTVVTDKISVNCVIRSGQLIVNWRYSSKHYTEKTIKTLADNYLANLQDLIAHCVQQLKTENFIYTLKNIKSTSKIKEESHTLLNQKESHFLVPIKKGKGKLPLYIVCGGGGTVFKFKKMVDLLNPEQSVFGLQQPTAITSLEEFPVTIEEIAAKYISEVLVQNPDGPYALAGHCSGGLVAYEMSKQLEAMGKKVELLVMFDTVVPSRITRNTQVQKRSNFKNLKSTVKHIAKRFQNKVDFELFLLREHTKDVVFYKLDTLRTLFKRMYPKTEEMAVYEVYQKLTKIIEQAARSYDIKPYNKNVVIYYAKDHYSFYDYQRNVSYKRFDLDESIKNRWQNVTKSFELYEIEGEHSTMFDPVIGGKELARLLQKQLDNCK